MRRFPMWRITQTGVMSGPICRTGELTSDPAPSGNTIWLHLRLDEIWISSLGRRWISYILPTLFELESIQSQGGPLQRRSHTRVLCPNTAVELVCIYMRLCTHRHTHRLSVTAVPTGLRGWSLNKSPAPSRSPESQHLSAHIISQIPEPSLKTKTHSAFFLLSSAVPFIQPSVCLSVLYCVCANSLK